MPTHDSLYTPGRDTGSVTLLPYPVCNLVTGVVAVAVCGPAGPGSDDLKAGSGVSVADAPGDNSGTSDRLDMVLRLLHWFPDAHRFPCLSPALVSYDG